MGKRYNHSLAERCKRSKGVLLSKATSQHSNFPLLQQQPPPQKKQTPQFFTASFGPPTCLREPFRYHTNKAIGQFVAVLGTLKFHKSYLNQHIPIQMKNSELIGGGKRPAAQFSLSPTPSSPLKPAPLFSSPTYLRRWRDGGRTGLARSPPPALQHESLLSSARLSAALLP